eukprot:gb/GECG01012653.1/.p1 GENE.gb/GECG01012653.1/~~gb/GECG01012653.1/.p1  ORF type:complete len:637 (+),score=77.88 gb/GECG01012653.1/:1-1911(+)
MRRTRSLAFLDRYFSFVRALTSIKATIFASTDKRSLIKMRFLSFVTLLGIASVAAASQNDWVRHERSPRDTVLDFDVALPESNLDQLDAIFYAVNDPDSPYYGKFKEPEELNKLTATPSHVLKDVWNHFESKGARCKAFWSHLECRATAEEIEDMFATEVYEFEHKLSGDKIHRVHGEYQFPKALEDKVEFVDGLTEVPDGRFGRVRPQVDTQSYTTVPETLQKTYNINKKGNSKSTQAAAEFQGYPAVSSDDLKTFISKTGIDSFSLKKKIGPFNPSNPGAESTLDVQYLGAVGQDNSNWYWTEKKWMYQFSNEALKRSKDNLPDVISMSYGWAENQQCKIAPGSKPCGFSDGGSEDFVKKVNTNFQKLGSSGVTLLAASGDAGAHGRSDSMCNSDKCTPSFPASSPYVTAVGATMFRNVRTGGSSPICSDKTCAVGGEETTCTSKGGAALITSGGGFSEYASMPDYQKDAVQKYLQNSSAVPSSSDFNSNGRGYPDVAAIGHAYYIELNGQESQVDGTSASCPVFAGVIGLLNAHRLENGGSPIGFANPLLYKMANNHPSAFNDVTSGNNKCTEGECCSTGFYAAPGWDATTGLGTPNVKEMLSALDEVDGRTGKNTGPGGFYQNAKTLRGDSQ